MLSYFKILEYSYDTRVMFKMWKQWLSQIISCLTFVASVLRVLPGSDLGARSAGVQMYSVQATSAQEMSQGGAQTMPECSTATTTADAKHRIADDRQKWRSTTAWFCSMQPSSSSRGWNTRVTNYWGAFTQS